MNRPALRWIPLFITVLAIPFLYNSCQGGLLQSKGFSSSKSSSCKAGLFKGTLAKLADQVEPSPFANGKVQLNSVASAGQQKASEESLQAGQDLTVVMNNACLANQSTPLADLPISKAAAQSGQLRADLDHQAYLWTLERSYLTDEIQSLADGDPCVVGVSWNRKYKIQALSDPGQIEQNYLRAINYDSSLTGFYNSAGGMDKTGNPVIVAVIDTGVDWSHPDISDNLWRHSQGIGIDITTLAGTVDYNPMDASSIGHGTHVAGMIAAVSDNALGISGVMPFRAKTMTIKLFAKDANGDLSTTSQHFYNALRFAYLNGASVANLSIGAITLGPSTDAVAESAVAEALGKGVTIVTVTGNADGGANGQELNGTTLTVIPGIYSSRQGVIGVGSFDSATGNKSFFSHYSKVYGEVAAAGAEQGSTGVYSTLPRTLSSYGRLAGTSQAAPQVSAAAALTIGVLKDAYGVAPTPAEVERLITESAYKDPKLSAYFKDGNRLDLARLIQKINVDYPNTRGTGNTVFPGADVVGMSTSACH